KPANIYLARMPGEVDYVNVLDFGIAKVVEGDGAQPQLTATGLIIGTPAYMSPEQVRGQPIDGRSDLYSLGVVIYEMLTGRVPFAASSAAGILTKHLLEQPPPLRPLLPEEAEVPEVVVQLVELLLEKTPEQRPASAAQVLAILEALSAGGAVGTRLVQDGPSGSAAMPTLLDRTEDAAGASAGGLPARGHLPAARAARAAPPHTPAGPARPRLLLPLGLSLLVLLVASAAVGWWLAASRQGTVAPPAAPHAETGSSSGEEGQPAPAAPGPADRPPAAATPQMAEQEPALSAGEPAAPPASSPTPPPPQPATEEGRGAAAAPAQVELLLDSRPRGARVVEQGKTLGTTPLVLSGLAGAVRQVTLLKPGYRQSRQSIPLGSTDRLELELARLPREPAPAPSLAPAPAPPAKQPAPAPPEPKPILFD
ncbi:MAG: PEGA domain-containing protein, partial [Deltaproteobacteria bacterium]|nr:PEGA domain-containing protein [Deltaproteobacteria bacterium]